MFLEVYRAPEELVLVNTDSIQYVEPVDKVTYNSPLWDIHHVNIIWFKDNTCIYVNEDLYELLDKFNRRREKK